MGVTFLGFGQCPATNAVSISSLPVSCFGGNDGLVVFNFNPITISGSHRFRLYQLPNTPVSSAVIATSGPITFTGGISNGNYEVRYYKVGGIGSCGSLGSPVPIAGTNISVGQPAVVEISLLYDNELCFGTNQEMQGSDPVPPRGQPYSTLWSITGPSLAVLSPNNTADYVTVSNLQPGTFNATWSVSVSGCGVASTSTEPFYVRELPVISSSLTTTVCSGFPFNYIITSTTVGSTFQWTRPTNPNISNAAVTEFDETINETLINTSATPQLVLYQLQATGPGATACPGIPSVLTVTVNPTPTANATPSSDTKCSGQPVSFALSSNLANTIYTWVTSITSGVVSGINSGGGSTITDTPINSGNASTSYLYIVTPQNTLTGCSGLSPFTIPVTINVLPTVAGTNVPTVCGFASTSINLATNGTSFAWSNGQSTNPATLTPVVTGLNTFTVTVSSGLCGVATTVGVFSQSTVTVQGVNATVCGLNSATISLVTNGSNINWFNGTSTNSISVVPVSFGINNYNATVTSGVCNVTTVVSVLAQPLITVSSTNTTVCGFIPTSRLLITNGTAFNWNTGQTTNPATLTPTIFGLNTFTATVSSGLCNVVTSVGIVAIAPLSVAGTNATVCGLSLANISITTNGVNINWFNGATTSTISVTPTSLGNTNYPVTISSSICQIVTTVGVTAVSPVTVSGNNATVCGLIPTSFTLSTNGTSFSWSTGQTANPVTLTPVIFGLNTFIVTVSSGLCSVVTSVGIFATSSITIAGNAIPTICGITSTSFTLTTNGTSFLWSNGQTANPATLTPATFGLNAFTATVSSGFCRVTTTLGIFVQSPITVQGVNATVCGLNSANISILTNGSSINWFNGATTGSISIIPASVGINNYNATVTSGSCSVTTTVSVLSLAVVTVSSTNTSVCGLNPTGVLLSTNGSTFNWSSGQSTNPATLTPLSFGLNTFTVTVSSGLCNAVTTVGIVANAPITIAVTNTTTVCGLVSASVTLTTNGNNFNWSNGQTTNPAILTPSSGGLNSFTVTVNSGLCNAITTVGVFSLNLITNISGNPASPICSGSTVNVTASSIPSGGVFDWATQVISGTANGNSNVSASNSINQSLTSTGLGIVSYTVVGTLNGCAGSPAIFNVTVNPAVSQPTFISGSNPICQGTTNVYQTDLPASLNASSITWSVFPASAGSQILTQNVTTVNWNAAFSGNVTLTATAFGCGASQSSFSTVLGISANPTFVSELTQQNNSCIADNGIITATITSVPNSIRLNNTINPASFFAGIATFSNLGPGTYTIVMRNAVGCATSSTGYNIIAPATPLAPNAVSAPAGNYCEGATVPTLTITVPSGLIGLYDSGVLVTTTSSIQSLNLPITAGSYNYSANVTVNGCVSPSTFIIYSINFSPSITGIAGSNPTSCGSSDGSLTVTGSASLYTLGSVSNATGIFTSLAPITHNVIASTGNCSVTSSITLSAPGQTSPPVLSGGNTYCAGQPISLLTVTSTISGTFGLYNASNTVVETKIGSSAVFNTTASGTYYANITVAGCASAQSNTENIIINAIPIIAISGNNAACNGNLVTVTANAGFGSIYIWSGAQTGNTAFFNNSGLKTVLATVSGCSSSLSFVTTINSNPIVTISASQTSVCSNANVTLTGNGANNFTWLPSLISAPSIVVPVVGNTIISVIGTDLNGCVGNAIVNLSVTSGIVAVDSPLGNTSKCSGSGTFGYALPNTKTFYNATTFNWFLIPAASGTITVSTSPNEHVASVAWNASFAGVAIISVVGFDACGNTSGNFTNVTINSSPTISSISTIDPSSCSVSDGAITITGTAASGSVTYVNLTANTTVVSGIFSSLSASPISSYNLRLVDVVNGCFTDATASLNPAGQPAAPSISGGNTYCTGQTVQPIFATSATIGGISIYLSPNIFIASTLGNSLSVLPSVSGNYFARFSDGSCVSVNSAAEAVTFNNLFITATTPNPVNVCEGSAVALAIIDAGATYAWFGVGLDVNFGGSVNATPTFAGTNYYVVTALGSGSCTASFTFTVNGLAKPTTQLIATNQTVCGDNINLALNNVGGTSLTYFDGFVNNTVAFAGNGFNVPLTLGDNIFSLISVSGASCFNTTASGSVTIFRRADTDPLCTCTGRGELIGGSGSVCEGGSSTFNLVVSVTGSSPLSVEILQNGDVNNRLTFTGLNAGVNANLAVSPNVTTDYTIYQVNSATCQGAGSGSIRISVTPVPILSVTSPVIVNCTTTSVDLSNYFVDLNTTISGGITTYWDDANYTIPISNIVTASKVYYIRKVASGLSTCSGEAAISVVFRSKPAGIVTGGGSVCAGQSTNISASFTGGTAPYSFVYGSATSTSGIQSSSGLFSTSVNAGNDTYTVLGISDASGCAISVSGIAIVALSPSSLCGGNVVCITSPSAPILFSQVAQCGEIKLNWTPQLVDYYSFTLQFISGNVSSTGTTTGFNTSFSGLSAGNYNVIVSASNTCGTSSEATLLGVNTSDALTAVVTGGGQVCANQKALLSISLTGTAPFSVTLSNGTSYINQANNFTITVGGLTENYTIATMADATGCTNLITSTGTDVVGVFPQNASIAVASKFTSSCESGSFVFSASGVNGGTSPSFNWYVNNQLVSLTGTSYSVVGIDTIGDSSFLTISGLANNDAITAQLTPDPLVASCVLNASSIFSSPVNVKIENIDLSSAISYIPTQCLNSSDGVLYINLPNKYAGRTFSYSVNTIVGVVYDPLITVGGLLANKLNITITDADNPQCTLDTITNGTGTVNATIIPAVTNADCNANNGSIGMYFRSEFPNYNVTIIGLNTTTGIDNVISVVSNIVSDSASGYTFMFDKLGIGLYQINLEYNNCFASLPVLSIGGGSTPIVDLGEDIKICRGDSIILTTSGIAGGLYSWFKNDSLISTGSFNYLPIRPSKSAIYSVSVPGTNGCYATDFVSVNVADISLKLVTTALESDTKVNLAWTYINKNALLDTSFTIESRLVNGSQFYPWTVSGFAILKDSLFTHTNLLTKQAAQQFRVVGVNNAVCASFPHDLVYLAGTNSEADSKVSLNWTSYKGWAKGVDHYEVWRKLDDEPGFSFLKTAANDTTIELFNIVDGFIHEYRILAVSKEPVQDSIKSWSNIVRLEFNRQIEPYNAFSPNGDGKNDVFEVKNIQSWTSNEIFIFNRWGGKVFYAKPYRNDWTGDGMPDGTYFYIINLNDKNNTKPSKGSILLQR